MYLARVVGDVVSTHKNERLVGKKLLLVRKLTLEDKPDPSV
jgi:microcompartment protein CcmK/EutM